jgi:hypothetical protein
MTTASTHALHPQQDLVCQPFSQKKQIFFKPSEKQFSFLIYLTMEELILKVPHYNCIFHNSFEFLQPSRCAQSTFLINPKLTIYWYEKKNKKAKKS